MAKAGRCKSMSKRAKCLAEKAWCSSEGELFKVQILSKLILPFAYCNEVITVALSKLPLFIFTFKALSSFQVILVLYKWSSLGIFVIFYVFRFDIWLFPDHLHQRQQTKWNSSLVVLRLLAKHWMHHEILVSHVRIWRLTTCHPKHQNEDVISCHLAHEDSVDTIRWPRGHVEESCGSHPSHQELPDGHRS